MKPRSKVYRYRGGYKPGSLAQRIMRVGRSPLAKEAVKAVLESKPVAALKFSASNYVKKKVLEHATPATIVDVVKKGYELMRKTKRHKSNGPKLITNIGSETTKSSCTLGSAAKPKSSLLFTKVVSKYNGSIFNFGAEDALGCYDTYTLAGGRLKAYLAKMVTPSNYTQRMYVKSSVMEITYTNMSSVIGILTLYDYVPKHDTMFSKSLDAWESGMNNSLLGTSGMVKNNLASTPYDSPIFNNFFSVKNKTVINMAPGSVHIHKRTMHSEKSLSRLRLGNPNVSVNIQDLNMLSGFSSGTLCTFRGTPITNSTPSASGTINVNTSSTSIAMVWTVVDTFAYSTNVGTIQTFEDYLTPGTAEFVKFSDGSTRQVDPSQT